jgi:hypothetical protein
MNDSSNGNDVFHWHVDVFVKLPKAEAAVGSGKAPRIRRLEVGSDVAAAQ